MASAPVRRKSSQHPSQRVYRLTDRIWEKKYGKGAKHVVKAREEEKAKQMGKSRSGANAEGMGTAQRTWGGKPASGGAGARSGPPAPFGGAAPVGRPTTAGSGPAAPAGGDGTAAGGAKMHPSWEAARQRKKKEGAVPPAGAIQGQKIVFD